MGRQSLPLAWTLTLHGACSRGRGPGPPTCLQGRRAGLEPLLSPRSCCWAPAPCPARGCRGVPSELPAAVWRQSRWPLHVSRGTAPGAGPARGARRTPEPVCMHGCLGRPVWTFPPPPLPDGHGAPDSHCRGTGAPAPGTSLKGHQNDPPAWGLCPRPLELSWGTELDVAPQQHATRVIVIESEATSVGRPVQPPALGSQEKGHPPGVTGTQPGACPVSS